MLPIVVVAMVVVSWGHGKQLCKRIVVLVRDRQSWLWLHYWNRVRLGLLLLKGSLEGSHEGIWVSTRHRSWYRNRNRNRHSRNRSWCR